MIPTFADLVLKLKTTNLKVTSSWKWWLIFTFYALGIFSARMHIIDVNKMFILLQELFGKYRVST